MYLYMLDFLFGNYKYNKSPGKRDLTRKFLRFLYVTQFNNSICGYTVDELDPIAFEIDRSF